MDPANGRREALSKHWLGMTGGFPISFCMVKPALALTFEHHPSTRQETELPIAA